MVMDCSADKLSVILLKTQSSKIQDTTVIIRLMKKNIARLFSLLILVAGASLLIWTYQFNGAQKVQDWWYLRSYEPSEAIVKLADDTYMSDKGRDIFYITDPQLQTEESFNENCSIDDFSIILGCFSAGNIYVYDVNDPRIADVEEVTAAHEMLHAVYERLDAGEREEIDNLVRVELANITDQRLLDLVELYRSRNEETLNNEMHSIFGTELMSVSLKLEEHYSQYFKDRQVVVSMAQNYASTFVDLQNQLQVYDDQLEALAAQIQDLDEQSKELKADIEQSGEELDRLLSDSNFDEFNSVVPVHNQTVNQYNSLISDSELVISQYNQLVRERNAVAYDQKSLIESISSKEANR